MRQLVILVTLGYVIFAHSAVSINSTGDVFECINAIRTQGGGKAGNFDSFVSANQVYQKALQSDEVSKAAKFTVALGVSAAPAVKRAVREMPPHSDSEAYKCASARYELQLYLAMNSSIRSLNGKEINSQAFDLCKKVSLNFDRPALWDLILAQGLGEEQKRQLRH